MKKLIIFIGVVLFPFSLMASEADLVIPDAIKEQGLLYWGFLITLAGMFFGYYQFLRVKK